MKREMDGKMAVRMALLGTLSCVAMFAQGPISDVAAGVSQEAVFAMRFIAALVMMGLGISIAISHNHGVMGRVVAALFGLYIAINPTPVLTWIQGLHG